MLKAFYFLSKRNGMSREGYIDYYENSHQHLMMNNLPNPADFRRHFFRWPEISEGTQGAERPDSLTAITYKDMEDVNRSREIYHSADFNPIIVADELRFIDRDRTKLVLVQEVIEGAEPQSWRPAPMDPGGKLLRLVWRSPHLTQAAFRAEDAHRKPVIWASLPEVLDVRRNYVLSQDAGLPAEGHCADLHQCDLVEEYSFGSASAAAAAARLADLDLAKADGLPAAAIQVVPCDHYVTKFGASASSPAAGA